MSMTLENLVVYFYIIRDGYIIFVQERKGN